VTRGRLPQRAGSLGLNGGGAAAAVPPGLWDDLDDQSQQSSRPWLVSQPMSKPISNHGIMLSMMASYRWLDFWHLVLTFWVRWLK